MRWGIRSVLLAVVLGLVLPGSVAAFGPLGSFGGFGSGAGQLDAPRQLAVGVDGDVYVADSGNGRIVVFAGDGTFRRAFGEGVLANPVDVAVAADGTTFVADPGLDVVAVFGATGAHVGDLDSPELTDPVAVALSGLTVYVAIAGDDRMLVYEGDGDFIDSFTTPDVPRDVIVGADGNLYLTAAGKVNVLTPAGASVEEFGDAQLDDPAALAENGSGEVFVVDRTDEAVERFDAAGAYLGGFPAGPEPAGVATACGGNVFVAKAGLSRVERYGEPETPVPPCATAAIPISAPVAKPPSNRFRFAGLLKNRSNGSAVLLVRVPGPGRVILKGRGVRRLARGAAQAKVVRLPVKPKVRLRHYLKQHGKGRIRVEVTFKPVGGVARTEEKVIVLRRARAG